jgi:hypothetical protein
MRRALIAPFILLAGGSGCVIVDPSCSGASAAVVVSPSIIFVSVGESFTPDATFGCDGHRQHTSPNWSIAQGSDAGVISLDLSSGRITGLRSGHATVIASPASGSGSTTVSVTVR